MGKLERSICVYLPEAHGFQTGSNNGNYRLDIHFRIEDGKYYIKDSSSGDGDVFPYSEWEEVTAEEYAKKISQAGWEEAREYKLLENNSN